MEYLEGMDLGGALEKHGHFDPPKAIRIALQICRALGLGHARGVVHRDLKPENIFLQQSPDDDEEVVKIVDFGIAQLKSHDEPTDSVARPRRLTKTGMIFGTPEYMAPEQARGRAVDQRSDIYSTGVILYELLTGAVPFLGESFLEVLNQHVSSRVPALAEANAAVTVSPELERAVMRALEKDPADRYPTMKEFSLTLQKTPEGRSARARVSSITDREEDEDRVSARIESSSYPKPAPGSETAMFGSAVRGDLSAPLAADLEGVSLPTNSSRSLILGVLVAASVLVGGAGYLFLRSKPSSPSSAELPAALPQLPAQAAEPTRAPAPAPEAVPPPAVSAGPALAPTTVTLSVITLPAGAVVKKAGFEVCDAAPCEVQVPLGEAVTLSAELGRARGEAKVLAQKDQTVSITLLKAAGAGRPSGPQPKASALCEVLVDGIKILRPCE
jgi:serine/threonine-protein kinase